MNRSRVAQTGMITALRTGTSLGAFPGLSGWLGAGTGDHSLSTYGFQGLREIIWKLD